MRYTQEIWRNGEVYVLLHRPGGFGEGGDELVDDGGVERTAAAADLALFGHVKQGASGAGG